MEPKSTWTHVCDRSTESQGRAGPWRPLPRQSSVPGGLQANEGPCLQEKEKVARPEEPHVILWLPTCEHVLKRCTYTQARTHAYARKEKNTF